MYAKMMLVLLLKRSNRNLTKLCTARSYHKMKYIYDTLLSLQLIQPFSSGILVISLKKQTAPILFIFRYFEILKDLSIPEGEE